MVIKIIDTFKPNGVPIGTLPSPFPTVEDNDVLGGYQVVPNAAARLAIPSTNQKVGMLVYEQDNSTYYTLTATGTPGAWVVASFQVAQSTQTGSTYNIGSNDYCLFINHSGTVTVTLPTPTSGRVLKIKDKSGAAASNHITIAQHASETIDGASSYVLTLNYAGVEIVSDGTNWFVTAEYNGTVI
jgi:hypothetical protein